VVFADVERPISGGVARWPFERIDTKLSARRGRTHFVDNPGRMLHYIANSPVKSAKNCTIIQYSDD
jgi:hypothetical protein